MVFWVESNNKLEGSILKVLVKQVIPNNRVTMSDNTPTKETMIVNDFALLFDINDCVEGDKYLNTVVSEKFEKVLASVQHTKCDVFNLSAAKVI